MRFFKFLLAFIFCFFATLYLVPGVRGESFSFDYIKGEGDVKGVKIAYQFYQKDLSKYFSDLKVSFETSANFWEYGAENIHDSNFVFALSPVLRKTFCNCLNGRVYGEFGIGVSFIDDTKFAGKNISTHYQFEDRIGLAYAFGNDFRYKLALRYFHYSNGGLKKPNPGLDFISFSFLYKI